MAETSAPDGPAVTGSVAFYKRPEPLSAERHGKLGVARNPKPFLFARTTNIVPITVNELVTASLDYPVIFLGPERTPAVVLGLNATGNAFIDENGTYERNRYIPAFIRRYPFVFAEDKTNNRFVVCVDVEAPMVSENADTPFFDGQEATQYTRDSIDFLSSFEQQRRETQAFVERLKALDLFHETKLSITPNKADGTPGEPITVAEYVAVSPEKLAALPAETLVELRDSGHLAAIYFHLHSLRAWQGLLNRAGAGQAQAKQEAAPEPAPAG